MATAADNGEPMAIDFRADDKGLGIAELKDMAKRVRSDIIRALGSSKSGHPGGSLSCTDILVALYFSRLRHDPKNPKWPDRDRLLLSKGHAAPALYSVLAECGYFPVEELSTLRRISSRLQGHPDPNKLPGIEIPGGPEGIGLSEGIGMALASRLDGRESRIYVIIGDGELDEGEVWEAAMAAVKFKLDNLTVIIDKNGVQQEGKTADIMPTNPVAKKFEAFNWNVIEIDGHDIASIIGAIDKAKEAHGGPTIIVANTIKGKGVDFMEGRYEYHGKVPSPELLQEALDQINGVSK